MKNTKIDIFKGHFSNRYSQLCQIKKYLMKLSIEKNTYQIFDFGSFVIENFLDTLRDFQKYKSIQISNFPLNKFGFG